MYKATFYRLSKFISKYYTYLLFKVENISIGKDSSINGIPIISVSKTNGILLVGDSFSMNSGKHYNQIGRQQPCYLVVGSNAKLIIGNNVGISSTAIICFKEILIDDNVKIGGNTVIYDSDFHDIDYKRRTSVPEIRTNVNSAKVHIKKNAFLGAHSTILKGVVIGENSIIGACSVVTKDIPDNEIWAGNPAKFIRKV